jgi:DNA-binding NtrC family response regulator
MSSPVVLCVDDDDALLDLETIVLERAGYRVITASNSADALAALEREPIDVVVSDRLAQPGAGSTFIEEMKRRKPDVPILLCTGVPGPIPDAQFADDLLTKPGGPQALVQHVAALLARSRERRKPH